MPSMNSMFNNQDAMYSVHIKALGLYCKTLSIKTLNFPSPYDLNSTLKFTVTYQTSFLFTVPKAAMHTDVKIKTHRVYETGSSR